MSGLPQRIYSPYLATAALLSPAVSWLFKEDSVAARLIMLTMVWIIALLAALLHNEMQKNRQTRPE